MHDESAIIKRVPVSKVGKVINQIANKIRIFLKPDANSIVSTASLLPARPSELDPHRLSPYFKFSTDFYLHESVVKISRRQSLLLDMLPFGHLLNILTVIAGYN